MIDDIVKKEFDDYTKEFFKDNEGLKKFILNHPNKHKCIANVITEIKIAELKVPELISYNVIKEVTQSFVKNFAKVALHSKEKEILSTQALLKQKMEHEKVLDFQKKIDNADTASVEDYLE